MLPLPNLTFQATRNDLPILTLPDERNDRVASPYPAYPSQAEGRDNQVRRQLREVRKRHRGLEVLAPRAEWRSREQAHNDERTVMEAG